LGSSAADRRDPTLAYFLGVLSRLQINVFRWESAFCQQVGNRGTIELQEYKTFEVNNKTGETKNTLRA